MSADWHVGFRKKPGLDELDRFMFSLGFQIDTSQRVGEYTRVYMLDDDSVKRYIAFFYEENAGKNKEWFQERANEVQSYGNLKTGSVEPTYFTLEERVKVIKEKRVKTQHDYYRHVSPERLKWYETALAFKEQYNAIVLNGQISEEINPEKFFPEKRHSQ